MLVCSGVTRSLTVVPRLYVKSAGAISSFPVPLGFRRQNFACMIFPSSVSAGGA